MRLRKQRVLTLFYKIEGTLGVLIVLHSTFEKSLIIIIAYYLNEENHQDVMVI